jgi:hypothetical protein
VLGPETEEGKKLLKWVIDNNRHNLETKTTAGLTPFLLAINLGRLEFARILIDAGANQTARNNVGANAIHLALHNNNPHPQRLREFFSILDPGVRTHLFSQRNNLSVSGTTPFHTWLEYTVNSYGGDDEQVPEKLKLFHLLLEHSGGNEIAMLNGAGDTCLHTAVMQRATPWVEALLEYRPRLLLRENAVGRTPAEVAYDFVTAQKFAQPRPLESANVHTTMGKSVPDTQASVFVDKDTKKAATKTQIFANILGANSNRRGGFGRHARHEQWWAEQRMALTRYEVWQACRRVQAQLAERGEDRRRLVSLHEANDVARRLGEQYRGADKTVNLARRNGDVDNMPDEEAASSAAGEDDPEKRATDYIGKEIGMHQSSAWKVVRYTGESKDGGERPWRWAGVAEEEEEQGDKKEEEESDDDEDIVLPDAVYEKAELDEKMHEKEEKEKEEDDDDDDSDEEKKKKKKEKEKKKAESKKSDEDDDEAEEEKDAEAEDKEDDKEENEENEGDEDGDENKDDDGEEKEEEDGSGKKVTFQHTPGTGLFPQSAGGTGDI